MKLNLDIIAPQGAKDFDLTWVEGFLDFNEKNKSKLPQKTMDILVQLSTSLGVFNIQRVQTLQPKALRSGVESVLRIDKSYKTLQQIDLSALS
jgi:hypothetical protein